VKLHVPKPELRQSTTPAIDPIRVEMLSTEMPIHQLAKRGVEEIRIIRRRPSGGQVTLYWKVEPNPSVGHPGQLAYHLDTWVIKRRLDDLPRPIPRLIRVGDLREIARDLGHGGDTNAVKRAFEQNASAFIRAKLAYRARDGREETFEGYFNRYNVFYRGQSLPGGKRAESVYISLNDPYYTLINGSTWRPLDYRYLRSLSPAAQRFYELVSPKIFATIKNGHRSAWIRYSDFCLLAVQRRQETRRRMQIQMAAVHRPHLASGYLAGVSWLTERGEDGSLDWTIHYDPGPRARAEFEAFNGGRWLRTRRAPNLPPSSPGARRPSARRAASKREPTPKVAAEPRALAIRFLEVRYGTAPAEVTETQLRRAQAILDACAGDHDAAIAAVDLAATAGRNDPAGFPNHLGGVLEGGFVERARTRQNDDVRRQEANAEQAREQARRDRYETWCRQRAAEKIDRLSAEQRRRIVDDRLVAFTEEFRFFVQLRAWTGERIRGWAEPRILERYGREGEPSLEEWRRRHDVATTGSSGPREALQ